MGTLSRFATRVMATASAVGLLAAGLGVVIAPAAAADILPTPAPVLERTPDMVTADSLPTVQIDSGVVWTQVVVGNTVYAGGSFSNTRPAGAAPGTNLTPRGNLLAYDITTGNLVTGFAPSLNGQVKSLAASPDGTKLYVGGSFTSADGQTRFNVAAYSTSTGQLLSTFRPAVGGAYVNAIAATNTTVYVGGLISAGAGVQRYNLMAFNAANGALLNWVPSTDRQVDAMVMDPSGKVIVGGRFGQVNGVVQRGLAALDPVTGALVPYAAPQTIVNGMSTGPDAGKAGIWALTADATGVYGTGWVFANKWVGNLEGGFAAEAGTGNIRWVQDCHGDHYGVFSSGAAVYMTGHPHACETVSGFPQAYPAPGNVRHSTAFTVDARGTLSRSPHVNDIYADWSGVPAPAMVNWFPDWVTGTASGQGQAGWTASGNSKYLVIGGEFPIVNGIRQQGLARFAVPSIAPDQQGPRLSGTNWVPSGLSVKPGTVRLTVPANWDRDDRTLSYRIIRNNNTAQPVHVTTVDNSFWDTQVISFTDTGLTPGATYSYRVIAVDGDGNQANSATIQVTVTSQTMSAYSTMVVEHGAEQYWRLGEPTGNQTVFDWAGTSDAAAQNGVTRQQPGAIVGDPDKSSTFNGTDTGVAATQTAQPGPNVFTAEMWINTTTTAGGKILGFGNAKTGFSNSYDRHVYMTNNGRIAFGVFPGSTQTVVSPTAYNDGQWHHVVASLGPNGMVLTIDGMLIGTNGTTYGEGFSGYWRIGSDNLGSWPEQPSSNSFNGRIDEVAIYPTVLTRPQIIEHYTTAGYTLNLPQAPADAYGAAVYNADPTFYWRLGDQIGSNTAADSGTYLNPGTVGPSVGFGQPGSAGINGTAANFNGGAVVSSKAIDNPTVYTQVAWFKTTTGSGGKIIGFGDNSNPAATSGNYDRHVYLQDDGRLVFGTWNNGATTLTSSEPLNDGQWHMVAASQGPEGMRLYIDAALAGENSTSTAQPYTGHWRIGGDNTWGSSSPWFNGSIDDVAVWSRTLPAQDIASLYQLGIGGKPTASFTVGHQDLTAQVDASASTAVTGRTIAQYSWNWGDDSPAGSGATASHNYAAAGTYPVALTVTDNRGVSDTKVGSVTVTAPHLPPTAVIGATATSLSVQFSSSGSTTTDGATIAGYAWDFGDGTASTEANPVHVYEEGDTYEVTLVVTDNLGASSAQVTRNVTVSHVDPVAAFTAGNSLLQATVNASATTAFDGATLTYDWNWGDSSPHGAGVTATHTYAAPGSYQVTLTVTDSLGGSATVTHPITVTQHAAPVPSFQITKNFLAVSVDASATTASDGATVTYDWNWGDSSAHNSGVTATHTYAAAGTYTVTLTATDNLGGTATKTAEITVAAHQAPVAAFTTAVSNLSVTTDAATSSAFDGATLAYSWNWGDTTSSTGVTAAHSYTAAGTYSVTLTVTDSLGASSSTSSVVTVQAPPVNAVATDLFERSVATGWGTADLGGAWSGTTGFTAAGGKGIITVAKSQTRSSFLAGSTALDTNSTVEFSLDKVADGGGVHFNLASRRTAAGEYRAKVRISATGVVQVSVAKLVGTTETLIANRVLGGVTYTAGTILHLRLQTTGSGTTQLNLKAWTDVQPEPTAWTLSATDSTAQLQVEGTTGVSGYVSGTTTNGPIGYVIDELSVIRP